MDKQPQAIRIYQQFGFAEEDHSIALSSTPNVALVAIRVQLQYKKYRTKTPSTTFVTDGYSWCGFCNPCNTDNDCSNYALRRYATKRKIRVCFFSNAGIKNLKIQFWQYSPPVSMQKYCIKKCLLFCRDKANKKAKIRVYKLNFLKTGNNFPILSQSIKANIITTKNGKAGVR